MPDCILGQFRYGVKICLFHDVLAVCLNRFDADVKSLGDFPGASAFGDQLQQFTLPAAQLGCRAKREPEDSLVTACAVQF